MMQSISDDYFTSAFIQESPSNLLEKYNEKLIKSLLSLFSAVERTLTINLSEPKELLLALLHKCLIRHLCNKAFMQQGHYPMTLSADLL